MAIKNELRTLIAQGKTRKAIKQLLRITGKLEDKDLYNDVVFQSSRYEEYLKNKMKGTLSNEALDIALGRVNEALLEIIDRLPDEAKAFSFNTTQLVGWGILGALIVIAIVFIPQLQVFQGIFGQASKGESLTVFVHGKSGRHELILQNKGKVELTYGTKKARESINDKGQAVFNEIPTDFFAGDTKVYINVVETEGEPYRAIYPDSLYKLTPGDPIYLPVALLGLDKITGTVYFEEKPLEGVTVSIGNIRVFTNDLGYYELIIPEHLQKQQQKVKFYKEGYKLNERTVYPQTGAPLPAIMEKEQ